MASHHFDASPQRVAAGMTDPDFGERLHALPDVASVEVIASGSDGSERWLALRMVYGGSLDPIAARVLGSSEPSWIQTQRVNADSSRGTLEIQPEHHRSLLHCTAAISLAAEGAGTVREMRGELAVKVPLLGGRAERALHPAILARIDVEARLLSEWLNEA